MSPHIQRLFLAVCIILSFGGKARAEEIFAKGSISKNYLASDSWTISISGTGGLAFMLAPQIRIEMRYTNVSELQNKMDINGASFVGQLSNIITETSIYSAGVDIDLLGDKSAFQPFIYVGGGYVVTQRSYIFTPQGSTVGVPFNEGASAGVSGNLGLGIRFRIARSVAIEIEAYSYAINIDQPRPLINLFGTAGIRIFL